MEFEFGEPVLLANDSIAEKEDDVFLEFLHFWKYFELQKFIVGQNGMEQWNVPSQLSILYHLNTAKPILNDLEKKKSSSIEVKKIPSFIPTFIPKEFIE